MTSGRHPLESVLGHQFSNRKLLEIALTHRGALGVASSDNGKPSHTVTNERLEFLGDRVLGLVIAETLYNLYPEEEEGALAARLAHLVSASTLAKVADQFGLAPHVTTAPGQHAGSHDTAILADACEAVIGALYLDGGLETAASFIDAQWRRRIESESAPPKDSKTALQEWAQGRSLPLPNYTVVSEKGPAHAPSFTISVSVEGQAAREGKGRTKRSAEQAAAKALLKDLEEASA
jgi:ribonuclease-3